MQPVRDAIRRTLEGILLLYAVFFVVVAGMGLHQGKSVADALKTAAFLAIGLSIPVTVMLLIAFGIASFLGRGRK